MKNSISSVLLFSLVFTLCFAAGCREQEKAPVAGEMAAKVSPPPPPPSPPPPPAAPPAIPPPPDVAAPPADAQKSASGLAWKVLTPGTGTARPRPENSVKVHYTGWTTDGRMFDSTAPEGKPAVFVLGKLIKGWVEGIQLMVAGEKRRFWIPEELAYKNSPRPDAPKGMLVFDVELISIEGGNSAEKP